MESTNSNITFRQRKSRSFTDLSICINEHNITNDSSSLDASIQSLPNTSITENEYTNKLQQQIDRQKLQIESANLEIEKISLENTELRKTIDSQEKSLLLLRRMVSDSNQNILSTPVNKKRRSTVSRNNTPTKMYSENSNKYISQICTLEKQVKNFQQELENSKKQIEQLNNTINTLENTRTIQTIKKLDNSKCSYLDKETLQSYPAQASSEITMKTENIKSKNSLKNKSKVIVIADQLGRGVRHALQNLLGEEFTVICLCKPGAKMYDLLSSYKQDLLSLTVTDYVVLMGGINDKNPIELKYNVEAWVNSLTNTNVLICEIPYNRLLNEKRLNYELRFICKRYNNSVFVDMNFNQFVPNKTIFATFTSRSLLKEILRMEYKQKMNAYMLSNKNRMLPNQSVKLCDKAIQTNYSSFDNNCSSSSSNESIEYEKNNDPNEFFRA